MRLLARLAGPGTPLGARLGALRAWFRMARRVAPRLWRVLTHPQDPNNLWARQGAGASYAVAGGPAAFSPSPLDLNAPATAPAAAPPRPGTPTAAPAVPRPAAPPGVKPLDRERIAGTSVRLNEQWAYFETLNREIRRLSGPDMDRLSLIITRLARRWRRIEEQQQERPKRRVLDVRRTLRANMGRYGGRVLDFYFQVKDRPAPRVTRPAKLLLVGDVSRSMAHYVTALLHFFHLLGFRFQVQSYVFSERPTYATPFMEGRGSFAEKAARLAAGAFSWNKGTRLGSSLGEILQTAHVDKNTYVLVATDGKIALHHGELEQTDAHLGRLRLSARQVLFLTPDEDFASNAAHYAERYLSPLPKKPKDYLTVDVPIWDVRVLWWGPLARHADRIFLVRTVADLVAMCEELVRHAGHPEAAHRG